MALESVFVVLNGDMKMNLDRLTLFNNWVNYLVGSGKNYDTIGRYVKYGRDFLESCDSISRKGYASYKKNSRDGLLSTTASNAILDLLDFAGVGYKRKKKTLAREKSLEKLSIVSAKNIEVINKFVSWLHENKSYSSKTIENYYYGIKKFLNMPTNLIQKMHADL